MTTGRRSLPFGWVAWGAGLIWLAGCAKEVTYRGRQEEQAESAASAPAARGASATVVPTQGKADGGAEGDGDGEPDGRAGATGAAPTAGDADARGPRAAIESMDSGMPETAAGESGRGQVEAPVQPPPPPPPCGQECALPRPICDEASGECVACLEEGDCTDPSAPFCIEQRCVTCRTSADCTDPAAARCEMESHMCVGCQEEGDCENVMDGDVAVGVCAQSDHRCVECTGSVYGSCGVHEDGKTPLVCDSQARRCTDRRAGVLGACAACVTDAECSAGLKCVRETVKGVELGHVCQLALDADLTSCMDARAVPYSWSREKQRSIDGAEVSVCVLGLSTCEATQSFPQMVECEVRGAADGCGEEGIEDALCVPRDITAPLANLSCAPLCGNSNDCPANHACVTTVNPRYCDPNPMNCYVDADCPDNTRCVSLTCVSQ